MAAASDMMNTIELIRNFWPDLQFTKKDLVDGNPDFIFRFFSTFIAEVDDKISYLINEEITTYEFKGIHEFDETILLYCKVAKLFKKIGFLSSLSLVDFYRINPKKMYPCVKFSIHFVVFINNCLDDVFSLLNENFKKLTQIESLKVLKQQCLQDSAENAENLGHLQETFKFLNTRLEETKELHEKMMQEKMNQEKVFSEKNAEKKALENEADNLEYELKLLEDQEEDLKDCIITERDYETLKNTEKYLETEQQRLLNDSLNDNIDTDLENVKQLEESAKKLSCLRLDSLDVETLHELRQQVTLNGNIEKKLEDELSTLNNTANIMTRKVENLKQTLDKSQCYRAGLKKKCAEEEEEEAKHYENEIASCSTKFEECQTLETEIIFKQEEMKNISEDENKLKTVVAHQYQKILNMEKKTTDKFYNMLLNMKNRGEKG